MKTSLGRIVGFCGLFGFFSLWPAQAQDAAQAQAQAIAKSMAVGPQHAFLAELEGTWDAEIHVWSAPGAPPTIAKGKLTRKMIMGGRALEDRLETDFMGAPFNGIGHTGYDNVTGKYWSTWFDNMSTGVTRVEGTADESTGAATLTGDTPMPLTGTKVHMRLEIYNKDGRQITETFMAIPGAGEIKTMKTIYQRRTSETSHAQLEKQLREAETAFAASFAKGDMASFASFLDEHAVFMGRNTPLRGKQEIVERWTRMRGDGEAPFSWGPERVAVEAGGELGMSTGPVSAPDGTWLSSFVSTWKRTDGAWKVVLDVGPRCPPATSDE